MTRKERIEKMLQELRYEIEVGMMQGDIGEWLTFEFTVPVSKTFKGGVVMCSFKSQPRPWFYINNDGPEPTLKIVK